MSKLVLESIPGLAAQCLFILIEILFLFYSSGLPGMQVAAANAYGVPNQSAATAAAAVTAATAGQLAAPSQAALAAQGLAAQQPNAAAAAGVVHMPYPPGAAATAAVQQSQINCQPTTLAL